MEENYFSKLYNVDISNKVKQKNGLNYVSWAVAWAEVKKRHPEATYDVKKEVLTYDSEGRVLKSRPWFDDGKSAWVETTVTIDPISHTEILPILDFKNKPMSADAVTSADANKSIQRCLTKACARHGIGLYVYEGEDLPEETKEANSLQSEVMELIQKKSKLSPATADKVAEICKSILVEENGDPRICNDNNKLKELKKKLMAVRKIPVKEEG